jgi:hypothetical protein
MRFDVHHFEQTAATGIFNVTKLPEIKFSKPSTLPVDRGDVFLKALGQNNAGKESNVTEEIERINPETLVTVLEIIRHISHGVVLDPASGIVL